LTKGILDNGRGSSREKVFNYAHEAETGWTSSIA
jgi:GTPase